MACEKKDLMSGQHVCVYLRGRAFGLLSAFSSALFTSCSFSSGCTEHVQYTTALTLETVDQKCIITSYLYIGELIKKYGDMEVSNVLFCIFLVESAIKYSSAHDQNHILFSHSHLVGASGV